MFSAAKDTAFNGVRPYLPRGVEPELALFMLTTLPVLTVALRTADENYRRPKPPPLPPGYVPPRVVRFPNSPAKVCVRVCVCVAACVCMCVRLFQA